MEDFRKEIIVVDHLTKDYGFGRGVFDVSITVHEGECYGYLGPNGAGKSTTIRHIMGFSKPQKGSIKIFGLDAFGNTDKILKKVGYLPGEPSLPAGVNGWGFLRMMQGLRDDHNDERLNYLLNLFKLDPAQDIKSMSLGDKRKLAVVAAFMHDPELLILDEPTSGLDPIMQHVFIDFIREEKRRGKAILLSSHIFSEVDATCDKISIIKDGKHVSTFLKEEIQFREESEYILHFANIDEYNRALKEVKYPVSFTNEVLLLICYKFPTIEFSKFLDSLKGLVILGFEEKKYTLQDYFMSFYKEERKFGGLAGIEGNEKEGEKK